MAAHSRRKELAITKATMEFRAWTSNYIHIKTVGIFTHPCPKCESGTETHRYMYAME